MKWLLILILLVSGCAHQNKAPLESNEVVKLLSPVERLAHECLQRAQGFDAQKNCLVGTPYADKISRSPSSDLLQKLAWFFESPESISRFLRAIRNFHSAEKRMLIRGEELINGRGVGVEADAFLGAGVLGAIEVINHKRVFGLFCNSGVSLVTDVGVQASAYAVQSLSCPDNQAYGGQSLTFSTGVSGELIGLPMDVGVAYSFGVNANDLIHTIRALRHEGRFSVRGLVKEMASMQSSEILQFTHSRDAVFLVHVAAKLARLLDPRVQAVSVSGVTGYLKRLLIERISLGVKFRQMMAKPEIHSFLDHHQMPNTKIFLDALANSFNMCDSIGGIAGLSATLSPAALGVAFSNATLLFELSFHDLAVLKQFTPLGFLHPHLFDLQELQVLARVAKELLSIPAKKSQCHSLGISLH